MKRRGFIRLVSAGAIPLALPFNALPVQSPREPGSKESSISRIRIIMPKNHSGEDAAHLQVETLGGEKGVFGPLTETIEQELRSLFPKVEIALKGKEAYNSDYGFMYLWQELFPGKNLEDYSAGIDPLTGKNIWGTLMNGRQSETGVVLQALGAIDNALWDLRGILANQPVYNLVGRVNRKTLQVYTRVGEGRDLQAAGKLAKKLFDSGHNHQKWYFVYGPKDGDEGLKQNIELVRVLREAVGPDAMLMFDNHSMRHEIGPEWVVRLAREIMQYNPFWLEEPTAPEDLEGYARIKGETGIIMAGGEHHYTRWQILPLLQRKCIDWVQSDPDWCGGISEWLEICKMVKQYPGVKVVPHCNNFMSNVQCVASQPVTLCPLVEYNSEGTKSKMNYRTRELIPEREMLITPEEPGLGPSLAYPPLD